ncbi:hypothetical protein [Marivita hallyeonensis]|uniref:Uncharacterized protein n=1 Tax=Marivita hallyeonensis TaxID=996342 RepID=A0A1M5VS98_9RHOB|nr:hypothetical protein [Marivita hallyeonensis]SHH78136.1 hypothetical protein SAMN05443551_3047 [Marivita hallyeonensis]
MSRQEVTAISLVTPKTRDHVVRSLIPNVGRALASQRATYHRLPLTGDSIDWVVNGSDELTVALDDSKDDCVILVASRGAETEDCTTRLANVAADLCRDFDAHTVFLNGAQQPIPAADFINAGDAAQARGANRSRIIPRKVRVATSRRREERARLAKQDNLTMAAMRSHLLKANSEEFEHLELEERRAKSAPLRLSAWAMSFSTALIAAPLAIPLLVHNLVRGEDVKSGAMALGVAGLYAALAHTGMAPGLTELL